MSTGSDSASPGTFALNFKLDALVRLDADAQRVAPQLFVARRRRKSTLGGRLKTMLISVNDVASALPVRR